MSSQRLRLGLAALLFVIGSSLAACSDDGGSGGGSSSSEDAGTDTEEQVADAEPDVTPDSDAQPDAEPDAPLDTGPDAQPDAQPDADATIDTGPELLQISGQVVSLDFDGAEGAQVVLLNDDESTTTNADGEFEFSDVEGPYDIAVIGAEHAIIYVGVQRADPTLLWPDYLTDRRSARLSGKVTGFSDPTTAIAFVSDDQMRRNSTTVSHITNDYDVYARWFGPDTVSGTLHALNWDVEDASPYPAWYNSYGTRTGVTMSDGDELSGLNFEIDGVIDQAQLEGNASVPPGYQFTELQAHIIYDGKGGHELVDDDAPTDSFSILTPQIAGVTLSLVGTAESNAAESGTSRTVVAGLAPDATAVDLEMSAAPQLSAPEDNATDIDSNTEFSWTDFATGVNLLGITKSGGPNLYVVTDDTTTKIPDLSSYGFELPADTRFRWSVAGVGPTEDMDAAADPVFLNTFAPELLYNVQVAPSARRNFRTSP